MTPPGTCPALGWRGPADGSGGENRYEPWPFSSDALEAMRRGGRPVPMYRCARGGTHCRHMGTDRDDTPSRRKGGNEGARRWSPGGTIWGPMCRSALARGCGFRSIGWRGVWRVRRGYGTIDVTVKTSPRATTACARIAMPSSAVAVIWIVPGGMLKTNAAPSDDVSVALA